MGKIEHKTCIGLCSSFACPETRLTFREITCSEKDLKAIDGAASLTGGMCRGVDVLQDCGEKILEFLPLSQPVREWKQYISQKIFEALLTF